jgi:hypothetical protein
VECKRHIPLPWRELRSGATPPTWRFFISHLALKLVIESLYFDRQLHKAMESDNQQHKDEKMDLIEADASIPEQKAPINF